MERKTGRIGVRHAFTANEIMADWGYPLWAVKSMAPGVII
jgi:hypothetical protein